MVDNKGCLSNYVINDGKEIILYPVSWLPLYTILQ
jgi:hypothetical protein